METVTKERFKRMLDVLGAILGLLLLSPVMLVVAVLVRVRLGSPIFFRQERAGLNSKPFTIVKFRTMHEESKGVECISDEERLTKLGRFLRNTSLDELPELWNVLIGEMSLVGPRPLLMEYLPLYSSDEIRRHQVRPGMTGWAQINGRNAISWDQKLAHDVWYVDHHTIWLDMIILWSSIPKVFRAEDVSQAGHATTEKFRGHL